MNFVEFNLKYGFNHLGQSGSMPMLINVKLYNHLLIFFSGTCGCMPMPMLVGDKIVNPKTLNKK